MNVSLGDGYLLVLMKGFSEVSGEGILVCTSADSLSEQN